MAKVMPIALVVLLIALALPEGTVPQLLPESIIGELPLPILARLQLLDAEAVRDGWSYLRRHVREVFWLVAALLAARELYKLLTEPLVIVRKLEERGYIEFEKRTTLKDTAAEVTKRRKRGDLPPVYPNGWFRVCDSDDVKVGEVKTFTVLGEGVAVFRGENGQVYAVDAYCPHLGANLGVGGRVIGNCVECPFHGWTFRGDDGKCVRIPYSKSVPDNAKTKPWTVSETNSIVYVWYHAENEEPMYVVEEIDGIASGKWHCAGSSEHMINSHIQEIPENGADVAHLNHLHGPFLMQGVDLRFTNLPSVFSSIRHGWTAAWEPLTGAEKHIGVLKLSHHLTLLGWRVPGTTIDVEARQIGPSVVHLHFTHAIFGKGVLLQELTPVEPLLQRMTHQVWGSQWMPSLIAKIFLWGEYNQVERDLMIWNNKRYVSKPMLVKEDELIKKHRRWYNQFYSENSPRYAADRTSLDW